MKFQKGNPGRPAGSKNKKLEFLRSHDMQLQKKVLSMALAGDISALKLIADRLWPRLRAEAAIVSIDTKSNDLSEQGRTIIDAGLRGEITVDTLRDLLSALFAQSKIVELAELEDRLRKLEEHRIAPPWERDASKPELRLINDQEILPMRSKTRKRRNK